MSRRHNEQSDSIYEKKVTLQASKNVDNIDYSLIINGNKVEFKINWGCTTHSSLFVVITFLLQHCPFTAFNHL